MNRAEAVRLCAYAAQCFPHQKINEFTPDAWGDILINVRYVDAHEAVKILARKQTFAAPAEIIAEVKRMRAKRIDDFGPIIPPADLDPDNTAAYREWWVEEQRRIADGELKPRELGPARTDADVLKRVALEARKVR